MKLTAHFDMPLVLVSVMVAVLCSLVALLALPRIKDPSRRPGDRLWIAGFGIAFGSGIWSMHFIAMQAWVLPIPVRYDIPLTAASLLLAIAVSAAAIAPLRHGGTMSRPRLAAMSILMGSGIAGMHYTGMAAMRMPASMQYQPAVVVLSIMIAIGAAAVALLLAGRLRRPRITDELGRKCAAALLMGAAIAAMHYTAMIGVRVTASAAPVPTAGIDAGILAAFVLITVLLIQGGMLVTALLDEAYGRARASEERMRRRADLNKALRAILATAIERQPLPAILGKVLDILLAIDWLSFQKRGSIFLADEEKRQLRMVAQRNLEAPLLSTCAVADYGRCLCGMAAEHRQIVFRNGLDADHHISFTGIRSHGHYCIPVLDGERALGVINLYVNAGHQPLPEVQGFLAAVADAVAAIVRSRRTEEHSEMLSAAIEQAGEAVMVTDRNGRFVYVNRAFTEISGYRADEAIGRKPSILKSGRQEAAFYRRMWETILAGRIWQGEVIARRKDGSCYPAMLTISPVRIDGDEISHFVGIHEDLSGHKRLEAELRQAQKMEALGTLVGGVAHEFNNMLAGIMGNAFLAKSRVQGQPDLVQKLERIETIGVKAADMIKQMLLFARDREVAKIHLHLGWFLREMTRMHRLAVPENIHLEQHLQCEDLHIEANPTQLQQVILNLIGNAVDALQACPDPTITIGLERIGADDIPPSLPATALGYAHIYVADNGPGIAPGQRERIFDPFFTTKAPGKGTGLGLAVCDSIIRAHRGLIEVGGGEGEGAVFHIYLPLVERAATPDTGRQAHGPMQAHGEKVLVVDDETDLRVATVESLTAIGFRVMSAANGKEALDLCRKEQPDVVLLDIVMPVMSGPETARTIQAAYPDIRIIFATGYDREGMTPQQAGLESVPVLSKPFSIEALYRTIMEQLAGRNRARG